jgi:hypothetical protein
LDDRVWKNISIGLGIVCALLIGVAGALMIVGHKSAAPAATAPYQSAIANVSLPPGVTPGPSTSTPQSQDSATPGAPTPTPGKASPATITFTGLGLDAANDTAGSSRSFTFTSDGPGPVTFAVTKISAGGTAKLCIKVDDGAFACKVGTSAKLPSFLTSKADQPHDTWTMTLIGYNTSTPTVDVTFTWPAAAPKVTLNHGRFQGSPEGINGFTCTFKPRATGSVNVQSAWTLTAADANVSLFDASAQPAVSIDSKDYKAAQLLSPAYTASVDPTKTYQVKVRRTSTDSSERPDLTAQISFP